MASTAATAAITPFILNLSRISQPQPRVAAMVVSEIMDRLSPNMAPPRTVLIARARFKPALSATATAMGPTAEMVPMEVPMAVAINAEIRNRPANINWVGTRLRPRFAVACTPPMAFATPEKAPASRNTMIMIIVPWLLMPLQKVSMRYSRLRSLPPMHTSSAPTRAAIRGTCLKESPP